MSPNTITVKIKLKGSTLDSLESQIKTLKAQIADGNNRERQLGILLESANYGVWDWYVQTGKITVSERCANIIGYTLEEISREWINLWEESVHPDDHKESDRLLEEHWAGKSDYYYFETRLKHRNGHWVWLEEQGRVVEWGSDGAPTRMTGTYLDITKKKEYQASGERLQAVVRTTVDAIITINSDGIVDSFNPAAENCFGYKAQEVIGKNVKILMEDFHKNHHDGYINQHLATGENKIIGLGRELEGKRKNGSLFPMELAVSKFKDGGDFVFTGIVRDISQRKNLESQLLQAHKETTRVASELTQLIDTANAPIFGIDTQGLVNEWNQEAVSLSGYSKDEVMGHDLVQEFITDEYKESVKQVLDDALRGIETGNYEFPLYTSEGERLEVLLNATSRKNVEGAIVGVIGVGQNITLQKQAQAETTRVASELTQLIDTANAPIFGIDTQGLVNEWNQEAVSLSGYSKDEVMGHDLVQEFITDEYKDSVKQVLDDALRGIETGNYEFPLYTREGKRLEVLLNATSRKNVEGAIVGVIGVGQNITLQKQAQAETTRVASELTQLIDTANAPIFGIDTQGLVNEWNQEAVSLSGYSKDEVMGHDLVQEFITDEYKESVKQVLDDALRGIETGNYEFPLYTSEGERLEVLLNATSRKNVEGAIVGVIGVGQNITLQKQAQAETTRVASELTQLIDTANAPIFGIDTQGLVNEWNQEAVSLSGYSKDEVMGHDLVQEFITDEYKDSVKQVLDDALRGIETGNYEFPLYTSEGKRLEVLLNATSRKNVEGAIVGVIGVGQNITELREKEGALNQMQKLEAVGQLTGGIAHDFNNLLSVIGGNLRFLREDIGTVSTEISELLEDAMSAADNATELTQQLLTFSKNKVLNPKVINANLIIEKFSRFISRTLGGKVELVVELAKRDLFLKVDPSQLDNALLNLCINSRDAMPAGGRITISVSQYIKGEFPTSKLLNIGDEKLVKISVKDTGEGIKADDLERVFEPFFTTKEVGKGSGLGLSMVYGFVKQSNGECFVESDYGRSTTVSILLEEVPELIRQNPQKMSSDNLPGETKIILVVEDEPRVRRLTLRDLKKLGYATIEAENADVARATLESGVSVDLVFTDVLMPGKMDGHMLALWVQENFPEVKVVLTSGYNKGKDEVFGNSVEYFPMVRKPYEVRTLAKIIRDELSKKGQGEKKDKGTRTT